MSSFPACLQFFVIHVKKHMSMYNLSRSIYLYIYIYMLAHHYIYINMYCINESLCHQTSWNKAPDKEEGGKSAPAEKEVAGAWVDGVVLM